MRRVAVIGCGGSGKSTLALRLGEHLGIPVYHLDRLYWQPGWTEPPSDRWIAIQQDLCAKPAWIIFGNYSGTLEIRLGAADTVVFLDLPTITCLWGAFRRYLAYRGQTRPDLAEDCPEQLNLEYLMWIRNYRRRSRPRVVDKLERLGAETRLVTLTSRRAGDDFVGSLRSFKENRNGEVPTL